MEKKDIVAKYKKKNAMNTVFIVGASLVLALAINIAISDNDFSRNLRTSIVDSGTGTEGKADVYTEVENSIDKTMIYIKNNKSLTGVKNISMSFSFDPTKTELRTVFDYLGAKDVVKTNNEPGFANVMLTFEKPIDVKENTKIISLVITKDDTSVNHLNISNVNFKDEGGQLFELSSSGIDF